MQVYIDFFFSIKRTFDKPQYNYKLLHYFLSHSPSHAHSLTTTSHSAVFSTFSSPIKLSTTLVRPHMKTDSLTHSLARSYSLSTRMTAHTRLASHDCTPYQICSVPRVGCLQHPQFERSRIDHCSWTPTNWQESEGRGSRKETNKKGEGRDKREQEEIRSCMTSTFRREHIFLLTSTVTFKYWHRTKGINNKYNCSLSLGVTSVSSGSEVNSTSQHALEEKLGTRRRHKITSMVVEEVTKL